MRLSAEDDYFKGSKGSQLCFDRAKTLFFHAIAFSEKNFSIIKQWFQEEMFERIGQENENMFQKMGEYKKSMEEWRSKYITLSTKGNS